MKAIPLRYCALAVSTYLLGAAVNAPAGSPDLLLDGCVIRFQSAVPTIATGAHHCSERVTSVFIDSNGDLRINTTPITNVVAATAAIDETLSARGIIAGASVALDNTTVTFYSTVTNRKVRPDSSEVVGSNANVFVMWLDVP